jgi:hypothetical protein
MNAIVAKHVAVIAYIPKIFIFRISWPTPVVTNIVIGTESIINNVGFIPKTIGNVRLPAALSPLISQISPSGDKIK